MVVSDIFYFTSVEVVSALVNQRFHVAIRKQLLHTQGTLWADDEIRWHLSDLISRANQPGWVLLDPLLASAAIKCNMSGVLTRWFSSLANPPKGIVTCVIFDGHWIPLSWTWTPSVMVCRSWDIQREVSPNMNLLHSALALAVGSRTWTTHVLHRMFSAGSSCGVCAVRFIDSILRGKMLPDTADDVALLQATGRQLFIISLDSCQDCPRPWIWGGGLDDQASQRLSELLVQHGVPSSMVDSRIALLCQAVGTGSLQKVLVGNNPWRGLKALANQTRPSFQFVLQSELEEVVKQKAAKGGQVKRKKGQGKGTPSVPVALDPAKVRLEPGYFTKADGSPLKSLLPSQIGPFAEGVVLASESMVEHFLAAGKVVSQFPLAVVIINAGPDCVSTDLTWAQLRVPVRCVANDDPMLVQACVVQLGKGMVTQIARSLVEVAAHPAACVKIAVYRDSVEGTWKDFVARPVRYVLDRLVALQTCPLESSECSCGKWHTGGDASPKDAVLDVWRRQWVNAMFKPVAPEVAEIFFVNVRYIQSAERSVLSVSGEGGLFIEPRSLDGKEPVYDWQVLWMHRMMLKDVLHIKQVQPHVIGVARLGNRFGVRVHCDHAVEVGALVKPDTVILAAGTRMDFEIGPIPFGLDRAAVNQLCLKWKWTARAVNPVKTLDGQLGTMWHVQSAADPPAVLFATQHGDIVVTKMKARTGPRESKASAIGSSETVGMCQVQSGDAADPWANYKDPWSASLRKVPPQVAVPDSHEAIRQVEDRIEKAVLAKLPKERPANMEVDGQDALREVVESQQHVNESRFQAMESQIQQLVQNHQALDTKIDANARKTDGQVNQLQCQVAAQFDAQSAKMEDMFVKQMDQLSALLAKRARTE